MKYAHRTFPCACLLIVCCLVIAACTSNDGSTTTTGPQQPPAQVPGGPSGPGAGDEAPRGPADDRDTEPDADPDPDSEPDPGSDHHQPDPEPFIIYEHVQFYKEPGPQVSALGFPRMPMIHNKDVRAEPDGDWLDVSEANILRAIDRLELADDYDGPIVIDYEPYVKVWDDDRTVAAWLEAIAVVRHRLPHAKVAVFGLPTVRHRPRADGVREAIPIELVQPVLDAVDFIAPQVYADSDRWIPPVEERTRQHMAKSREVGKPIVPFIRPRTTSNTGDLWMTPEVVLARIRTIHEMGAAGLVVWDKIEVDPADRDEQDRRQAVVLRAIHDAFAGAVVRERSDAD